ncbi:hypothetical protein SAY87_005206 [Trapa incisa]|uniref:Uncharacterized protein n=1 Tax=Trapa incisa TaxID=236973 RepID=A0AAN7K9F2_9MYRT|nr:hypothetical protein SAY87_005206 [Trapa incisa]
MKPYRESRVWSNGAMIVQGYGMGVCVDSLLLITIHYCSWVLRSLNFPWVQGVVFLILVMLVDGHPKMDFSLHRKMKGEIAIGVSRELLGPLMMMGLENTLFYTSLEIVLRFPVKWKTEKVENCLFSRKREN